MRICTSERHWSSSIKRMGQPIYKLATVHLIPTERRESALWLNRLASVIESEEFLKVCLYDSEASVDGQVAKAVCEEGEVGEVWIWVVEVTGFCCWDIRLH